MQRHPMQMRHPPKSPWHRETSGTSNSPAALWTLKVTAEAHLSYTPHAHKRAGALCSSHLQQQIQTLALTDRTPQQACNIQAAFRHATYKQPSGEFLNRWPHRVAGCLAKLVVHTRPFKVSETLSHNVELSVCFRRNNVSVVPCAVARCSYTKPYRIPDVNHVDQFYDLRNEGFSTLNRRLSECRTCSRRLQRIPTVFCLVMAC